MKKSIILWFRRIKTMFEKQEKITKFRQKLQQIAKATLSRNTHQTDVADITIILF